jgi:hypothetical protein
LKNIEKDEVRSIAASGMKDPGSPVPPFFRRTAGIKKTRRWIIRPGAVALIFAFLLAAAPRLQAKGEMASAPTNYEMVEAPTAYILMHGGYDIVTQLYDNGGLFVRANVGFKDFFMFGFSANATDVIGQGTIQIQTPRLFLKFKLLDQKTAPVALAVAWDDRGYGSVVDGRFEPGLQKGFYAVVSHEFPELGYLQAHAGMNVVQFDSFDSSRDLGAFFGTSFALAPPLLFNFELDKLLSTQWQFNANFLVNVDNSLRIGMDFRDINRSDLFARILRIQFMGFF